MIVGSPISVVERRWKCLFSIIIIDFVTTLHRFHFIFIVLKVSHMSQTMSTECENAEFDFSTANVPLLLTCWRSLLQDKEDDRFTLLEVLLLFTEQRMNVKGFTHTQRVKLIYVQHRLLCCWRRATLLHFDSF